MDCIQCWHWTWKRMLFSPPCRSFIEDLCICWCTSSVEAYLITNQFLDTGFIWNNPRITTECLEFVIQNSKLLEKMLKVAGSERQKVKPAAHLFSGRTWSFSQTHWLERNSRVNDWFDVMNSSWKFGKHPGVQAYGLNLEHQKCILDKMTECMTQMQMLPKNSLSQIEKISE